ncbi:SgcJ/EcaC family oxidoreductase [Allorhodopirellula solitaria]|uniref:SnoaL-like domain protein n=1 Tax=Allorhodopirellula solitaria TaxID=2527987 RepID=A0A5C5YHG5_9BACT|nr:SgcJ/EcaC family oxidoreductase [Allorhodopirellula solitaria]TWT74115.1 SnoaL-like domain protein [Allorhodopirellula solitaria]
MRFQSVRHGIAAAMLILVCTPVHAGAEDAEVQDAIKEYIAAFNAKNAEALAVMWTEDASHVDHAMAETTSGRDEIMADIQAVFKQPEDVKLSGSIDSVRMITAEVARVTGEVGVMVSGEEPSLNRYSAIVVNNEAGWQIDSMEEMPIPTPVSSAAALTPLEWLVGDWTDESGEDPVQTHVHWALGGGFLIRTCTSEAAQSTQIIGWDARGGEIRSWTFHSDGSHGEGVWSPSGDDWMIRSTQTLEDGRMASGTYVFHREGDDAFTIKLMGREIEGEPQVPSDPARVIRTPGSTQ